MSPRINRLKEIYCLFAGHQVNIMLGRGKITNGSVQVWCDRCFRMMNCKEIL